MTWDGGGADALWDTVLNWDNNAAPVNGDTLMFGSAFTSGTTINLNGNRTSGLITISTLSAFTISGSTWTLTSGDLTRTDVAGTEGDLTISSNLVLGGRRSLEHRRQRQPHRQRGDQRREQTHQIRRGHAGPFRREYLLR